MPNVRFLTLISFSISGGLHEKLDARRCEHLESLRFCWPASPSLPSLPPSLRHLNLKTHACLMSEDDDDWDKEGDPLPFNLPLLESLDCRETELSAMLAKRILTKSIQGSRLTELSIGAGWQSIHKEPIPVEEYPHSDSVRQLSLYGMAKSEDDIRKLVSFYPNVRKLDVSMTKITGVAIKEFVLMGVTHLRCVDCYHISPDAIEFTRAQGVVIDAAYTCNSRKAAFKDSSFARAFGN
jgi:F-box/TPR repeat protein Pof3